MPYTLAFLCSLPPFLALQYSTQSFSILFFWFYTKTISNITMIGLGVRLLSIEENWKKKISNIFIFIRICMLLPFHTNILTLITHLFLDIKEQIKALKTLQIWWFRISASTFSKLEKVLRSISISISNSHEPIIFNVNKRTQKRNQFILFATHIS